MYNREQWLMIFSPGLILTGFFFGVDTAIIIAMLIYFVCYAHDMEWSILSFLWRAILIEEILWNGAIHGEKYIRMVL